MAFLIIFNSMNIIKEYVDFLVKESFEEQLRTKEDFDDFIKVVVPKLVNKHMLQGNAVKVCSGISPEFENIARQNGFNVDIVHLPGHVINYVHLADGTYKVDLSAIQFEWCQKNIEDYEDELYFSAKERGEQIDSPFKFTSAAEKRELKRLLDIVKADPMRAIKIEKV